MAVERANIARIPDVALAWHVARSGPPAVGRRLAAPLLVVTGSLLVAVLVSGAADAYLGTTIPLALLGLALQGALFLILGYAGFPALLAWIVLTGVAFPFVRIPRESAVLTFDRLWILGLLGALALAAYRLPRTLPTRFLFLSFSSFAVVYGARALTTPGVHAHALAIWMNALVLPLILFVVTNRLCVTRSRLRSIAAATMVAGVVLAIIGIGQRIWGYDLASLSGGVPRYDIAIANVRISGPYSAPEPFALALVACLAATVYWMQSGRRLALVVGGALGLVELTALALTFFRAAWIAGAFVLFAGFALRPPRTAPRFIAVVALVGALAISAAGRVEKNSSVSARVNNVENVWVRLATYEKGIEIFRSAPLLGVGIEQFRELSRTSPPVILHGAQSVWDAHSTFINVLGEQGVVGLVLLMAVLVGAWILARTLRRRARAPSDALFATVIAAAGLGYLVMSFTLTMLPYGESNAFFAVLFGAAAGRLDGVAAGIDTDGR